MQLMLNVPAEMPLRNGQFSIHRKAPATTIHSGKPTWTSPVCCRPTWVVATAENNSQAPSKTAKTLPVRQRAKSIASPNCRNFKPKQPRKQTLFLSASYQHCCPQNHDISFNNCSGSSKPGLPCPVAAAEHCLGQLGRQLLSLLLTPLSPTLITTPRGWAKRCFWYASVNPEYSGFALVANGRAGFPTLI